MIGKHKSQFLQSNTGRPVGSSPLKRLEFAQNQKENLQTMNPMFANNGHKPLISPRKKNQTDRIMIDYGQAQMSQGLKLHKSPQTRVNTDRSAQTLTCSNHPTKKAQFRTCIQDGDEYFCGRCAAQLATQGCKVESLQSSVEQGMRMTKKNSLPHLPQYEQEPIYHEIVDILKLCNTVIDEHSGNIQRFSGLEQEYGAQVEMIASFYDRLICSLQEMKEDHLSDLMQERDKYTQIADIQNDSLRENIIEINTIKDDIEYHMEQVLQDIQATGDTTQCRISLDVYRQKLTLFRHQTEEQLDSLAQVTRYSQEKIENMQNSFENFLSQMWHESNPAEMQENLHHNVPYPKQMSNVMTVKNIHQILPKGVGYDNQQAKHAFRNLEAEQQENIEERKSPNFKKI